MNFLLRFKTVLEKLIDTLAFTGKTRTLPQRV